MPNPIGQWERFFIGGLGAAMPILANLLVIDHQALIINLTVLAVLGQVIKSVVFFMTGGLVIRYFYPDESNRMKIFQIGLAGPAMIIAMANGSKIDATKKQERPAVDSQTKAAVRTTPSLLWPGTVYAASATQGSQFKSFGPPAETPFAQVLRGITGNVPSNIYFVIAGSYRTPERALAEVTCVSQQFSSAEVYNPSAGNNYYSVVIGAMLPPDAARALAKKALLANLKDTYVWRLGEGGVLSQSSGCPSDRKTLTVAASVKWTDSGVVVESGESIEFSATGEIRWGSGAGEVASSDGSTTKLKPVIGNYPVKGMGAGGLIARVGSGAPFRIGSKGTIVMPASGKLQLGINDNSFDHNTGEFRVVLSRKAKQ